MTDKELFQYIKNNKNWVTTGLDVQFSIQTIKEEQKVYLIFQETRSTFDWKINLLFPAKTYKKYYIHKGYIKAWRSAKTLVAYFINEVEKTGFTPVICGWSYGGAMAVLAAEEYHYQTGKKAEVITFGAPKILYFKRTKKAFAGRCTGYRKPTCPRAKNTAGGGGGASADACPAAHRAAGAGLCHPCRRDPAA